MTKNLLSVKDVIKNVKTNDLFLLLLLIILDTIFYYKKHNNKFPFVLVKFDNCSKEFKGKIKRVINCKIVFVKKIILFYHFKKKKLLNDFLNIRIVNYF